MSSIKDLKSRGKKRGRLQRQVVSELNTLVRDIERCEKTIVDLQGETHGGDANYPNPAHHTAWMLAYLTDLLKCATKKLAWEKQIASSRSGRRPRCRKWRNC